MSGVILKLLVRKDWFLRTKSNKPKPKLHIVKKGK